MGQYFFTVKARGHFLILALLFLCLARGRASLQLSEIAPEERFPGNGEMMTMMADLKIGSRPPLCAGICRDCGRCEAVQVPAIPRQRNVGDKLSAAMNTRGDYSSNYKPLSWKCRCGDVLVNP